MVIEDPKEQSLRKFQVIEILYADILFTPPISFKLSYSEILKLYTDAI